MKTLPILTLAVTLCSCDNQWVERRIPTTEEERQMVKQHVEAIIPDMLPETLGGSDQDLEDIVIEAHNEARNSFCRPTMWEHDGSGFTGRWRYSEQFTLPQPERKSP